MDAFALPGFDLGAFVRATLAEDLGEGLPGGGHDITAESVIPADARFAGVMDSREAITVAGLPLGSTALRGESVMVNFIGSAPDTAALARIEGVHVHLYGKAPKPLRKIGHATVTAPDEATLLARLARVEALIDPAA